MVDSAMSEVVSPAAVVAEDEPRSGVGMAASAPGLFKSVPTENGADFTAGEDAEPSQLPL